MGRERTHLTPCMENTGLTSVASDAPAAAPAADAAAAPAATAFSATLPCPLTPASMPRHPSCVSRRRAAAWALPCMLWTPIPARCFVMRE